MQHVTLLIAATLANAAREAARRARPVQTATLVHSTPLAHDQGPQTSLNVEAVSQALVDCIASPAALAHSHQVGCNCLGQGLMRLLLQFISSSTGQGSTGVSARKHVTPESLSC